VNDPLARLHPKNDTRVICGMLGCGADIATVTERVSTLEETVVVEQGRSVTRLKVGEKIRLLFFPPGWARRDQDGVWRLTNHARRQIELGYRPKLRRGNLRAAGKTRQVPMGPPLPVRVECSTCGSFQTLDAARLRVETKPVMTYIEPRRR
jgi:hypothetical protein